MRERFGINGTVVEIEGVGRYKVWVDGVSLGRIFYAHQRALQAAIAAAMERGGARRRHADSLSRDAA